MLRVHRLTATLVGILLCIGSAIASPPGDSPPEQNIKAKPNRLLQLRSSLEQTKLKWFAFGDFDLVIDSSTKNAIALFPAEGKFIVLVFAAKGDEPILEKITVTVGEPPDPKPPIPPGPGPDGDPTPGLTKHLQEAALQDTAADRLSSIGTLARILFEAPSVARSSGRVKTAQEFQAFVKASTDLSIGPAAIPKTRAAVGSFISTILATNPATPTDESYWTKADETYKAVSNSLRRIK